MNNYTLKVLHVIKETDDAVTICFKQPSLRKLAYKVGQYMTLVVTINNRKYRRPYSFSSSPLVDSTLNITVKRVPLGIVSNHLIDMVNEGDLIEVIAPMGEFTYAGLDFRKNLFFWGAGSGITPLMSIIKSALAETSSNVILSYSNSTERATIFYDQLLDLQKKHGDRFTINFFFSKEKTDQGDKGRIDNSFVDVLMDAYSESGYHFICGPSPLKSIIRNALSAKMIESADIFSEDFENTVNDLELASLQTRRVIVVKDGESFGIEVIKGKNILETVLDNDIDVSYACQAGTCELCKGRLVKGKVRIINHNKISTDLCDDEILLCCSYPDSEDVSIRIE